MVTQRVYLGPLEVTLLFELEARSASVFDLTEVSKILRIPRARAAELAYRLKSKGRVIEVRKGEYLLVPARAGKAGRWSESVYRVVDRVLRDEYYVGFWAAMNYWGLTDQVPRIVHVAIPRRRRAFEFHGQRIRFVTLRREHMFGVAVETLEPGEFRVSDREKTIVDGLRIPEYSGGIPQLAGAIMAARDELRWTRLRDYVRRIGVDAVRRRLGYLLDVLSIDIPLRSVLQEDSVGFRWLDPSGRKERLGYSKKWGLVLNLDPEEIVPWRAA